MSHVDAMTFRVESTEPVAMAFNAGAGPVLAGEVDHLSLEAVALLVDGKMIDDAHLAGVRFTLTPSPECRGRFYVVVAGEVRVNDPSPALMSLVLGVSEEPGTEVLLTLSASLRGAPAVIEQHGDLLLTIRNVEINDGADF